LEDFFTSLQQRLRVEADDRIRHQSKEISNSAAVPPPLTEKKVMGRPGGLTPFRTGLSIHPAKTTKLMDSPFFPPRLPSTFR
jgi:hypothetical protein